ncbi:MAG: LPS assembly protein LptD [Acidobacteriia bacterium]|nr:LPS assembly protein LptD [Terriglobia bacterium]
MSNHCLLLHIVSRLVAAAIVASGLSWAQTQLPAQGFDQVSTALPYKDGTVVLTSGRQERISKTTYRLSENVRITYQEIVITCDSAEFDEVTRKGTTSGLTRFTQNKQWLTCSRAEFDLTRQTAKFYDAMGYTDQEFLIQGRLVLKTGRDTYKVERGSLTACPEKRPKWAFSVGDANIHLDQTAHIRRVLFEIKGVPVLYFPYLVVPLEAKKRSSGFLPFHTGNSTTKGRQFDLGWYQTLGSSADMTLYGDYFSLRGFGLGGILRARPNEQTHLHIDAYGVNDRQDQGGAHLLVDADTQFQNGFRAAAKVNITTNFRFRQTFSEGLRSATIPEEQALLFATRNLDSFSTNFSFERNEVFFPDRSLVIRKSPSMEFVSLGRSLGKLPLIFYLRAAAEGLSRVDSAIETPSIVQRLDFHPRLALRLPSLAGFSLLPSVGIRETYYSARLSDGAQPAVITSPLRRQYTDFEVELRTPGLERRFHSTRFGDFRHLVEPLITYRRIHGITHLAETIRFDDQDAIADTNEVEYGIVNRIMRRRETRPGYSEDYEFLAFQLAQKYYFDPTFGGAFVPDQPNLFYPLNTLSGFSSTGIQRALSPVNIRLRLTPRPSISWDVRADYDTKLNRLRNTSLWATWQHARLLFAGTYVKTNALEPSAVAANHIQGQIGYGDPQRSLGFSGSFTMSYNIQTGTLLNSNSRLNYMWNCCGISLQFQQFDLGLRTESRFSFSFNLKGIGNFGNIKRPENLF